MNTKNNKKSKNSIERIKKALRKSLQEQGHKYLTIKSVCETAHLNRTTFYAHYDSIEDALYQMCEGYITQIYSIFINKKLQYREKIQQGIEIIRDNQVFFDYTFKNVINLELHVLDMVMNNFSSSQDKEITFNNIDYAKLSIAYQISGFIGIAKVYFRDFNKDPMKKINIQQFTDIIFNIVNKNNPYLPIK